MQVAEGPPEKSRGLFLLRRCYAERDCGAHLKQHRMGGAPDGRPKGRKKGDRDVQQIPEQGGLYSPAIKSLDYRREGPLLRAYV
jgi:hypothetical protein